MPNVRPYRVSKEGLAGFCFPRFLADLRSNRPLLFAIFRVIGNEPQLVHTIFTNGGDHLSATFTALTCVGSGLGTLPILCEQASFAFGVDYHTYIDVSQETNKLAKFGFEERDAADPSSSCLKKETVKWLPSLNPRWLSMSPGQRNSIAENQHECWHALYTYLIYYNAR